MVTIYKNSAINVKVTKIRYSDVEETSPLEPLIYIHQNNSVFDTLLNMNHDDKYAYLVLNATQTNTLEIGMFEATVVWYSNDDIVYTEKLNIQIEENVALKKNVKSDVQKIYEAITAVILKRASKEQSETIIENVQIKYMNLSELIEAQKYYKSLYDKELYEKQIGGKLSNVIKIVM